MKLALQELLLGDLPARLDCQMGSWLSMGPLAGGVPMGASHGIGYVLGALFDIVNSLTAIGTAIALYAVIKRQNQGFAIGFVSSRLFEGTVLMIGVISILSIVTLQQPGATGAEASLLVSTQHTLVTVRNWTFVLGTGVPALNAFMLGWIMYKSRLVPRAIPVIGLIGAPLFTSWIIGYVLGVTEPGTAWHGIGVYKFKSFM